jgi:hypothetical protein
MSVPLRLKDAVVRTVSKGQSYMLLTYASNQASVESRWNQVGLFFGAWAAFEYFHVERILVASSSGEQFTLFNTSGMVQWVAHHWK